MSTKPKIIAIVGPTASGKSDLAVRLAKKLNGEIISADSQQVYKGLSVGTAKVPGRWKATKGSPSSSGSRTSKNVVLYKGTPHYCIDFVSPRKKISVAEFKKCADRAIREISRRGKIPILVGGTGFWIDAVAFGILLPSVPPNQKLRKSLGKKTVGELLAILTDLDSERARTVDFKNPRRLIRAVEIAKSLNKVPPPKREYPYDVLWLGTDPPEKKWKKTVKKRIDDMISSGLIRETKKLLENGISKKRIHEFGFTYALVLGFLEGGLSRAELTRKLLQETFRYKRKQMAWFRKNAAIQWISELRSAEKIARTFLSSAENPI